MSRRASIICTLQAPTGMWFTCCRGCGFDILEGASLHMPFIRQRRER